MLCVCLLRVHPLTVVTVNGFKVQLMDALKRKKKPQVVDLKDGEALSPFKYPMMDFTVGYDGGMIDIFPAVV